MKKVIKLIIDSDRNEDYYETTEDKPKYSLCSSKVAKLFPQTQSAQRIMVTISDEEFAGAKLYIVVHNWEKPIDEPIIQDDHLLETETDSHHAMIFDTLKSLREILNHPLPEKYSFWALVEPDEGGDNNEDHNRINPDSTQGA